MTPQEGSVGAEGLGGRAAGRWVMVRLAGKPGEMGPEQGWSRGPRDSWSDPGFLGLLCADRVGRGRCTGGSRETAGSCPLIQAGPGTGRHSGEGRGHSGHQRSRVDRLSSGPGVAGRKGRCAQARCGSWSSLGSWEWPRR